MLFALGFALRTRAYRWSGFAALALAASRLIAVDVRRFSPDQRILTFVLAGIALLVILRHHENIRRLLAGTEGRISFGKG